MASSTRAPLFLPSMIMLSLLLLLLLASSSRAADYTVGCNPNSYGDDAPFAASLEDLLEELVFLTPWAAGGPDVYSDRPFQGPPLVYGHAACRPGFVGDDCQYCLGYAATLMQKVCGHSLGGRSSRGDDCRVRYEQYAFTD
ncbi:unnamed protein product [Urochloa decumbens]|uniref:Gnk2-homologous domain-containing protein n=1 Tax=Urochloa decumbens TaxID=240449 RepID=A0ABC9BMA5_9POAL